MPLGAKIGKNKKPPQALPAKEVPLLYSFQLRSQAHHYCKMKMKSHPFVWRLFPYELPPAELRSALKISRSTEHRLLKSGLPCIGGGRLRRYDPEAAIGWFRTYAHQANTSKVLLAPGDYRCVRCDFQGTIQQPMAPGPCPQCGTRQIPIRVDGFEFPGDTSHQFR